MPLEKAQDPVRVEGAWEALVSRELVDAVQQAMRDRAPAVRKPGRVGSKFLLSGLLKCGVCGRPYTGQGAKSGQFAYYICGTLYREGAGACEARYLNAPRVEDFVVENMDERQSTRKIAVLVGGGPVYCWVAGSSTGYHMEADPWNGQRFRENCLRREARWLQETATIL